MDFDKSLFLALGFDAPMTDDGMDYSESGDELKRFTSKDGVGIRNLIKIGIKVDVVTAGFSTDLIQRQADLLGIAQVHASEQPRLGVLTKVMGAVGITLYLADAAAPIKEIFDVILERNRDDACIRDSMDTCLLPPLAQPHAPC